MLTLLIILIITVSVAEGSDSFSENTDYQVQDIDGAMIIDKIAGELHVNSNNPCELMPYVELSSLLVIDQLQLSLQMSGQRKLTTSELAKAKKIYYTLGLFAECATICLLANRLGGDKTTRIGLQWISGYHDEVWRENTKSHFIKAYKAGLGNGFRCYVALMNALQKGLFKIPAESVYGPSLDRLRKTLVSFKVKASDITASIESVALRCLTSTAGLSAADKARISIALGKSAALFRRMEGSALRKALPDDTTVNKLTSLVADGMLNAKYLKTSEKEKRMGFMLQGKKDRQVCVTKTNFKECMLYTGDKFKTIVD